MSIWKESRFKDFVTLQRGYDLFKTEYKTGKYPVVGATEIAGYHDSYKVQGPGITVGRTGTIGFVQLIRQNFWPHQDCLFVKDFKGNNLMFVYYVLKALPLSHLDAGGAVPALNRNHLDNIKLLLPPLPIQQRIASILSVYDELIEVNNQRIKLLEETASQLYKEWFVRMRFPGYKEAKFEKGIPEGWEIKPIGKVIDYQIGGGWGNDKKTNEFTINGYVIRGTDIPGIRKGQVNKNVYRFHKASNIKSRQLMEGDIIFETAGGSEGQLLGRTCFITQEILDAYGDKVMAASFCKQIRTAVIPSLYLYYFFNYLYDTGMIDTYQVQSTGISNYQFEPFLRFQQIILPKVELMKSFHDKVLLIQKQIATLGEQNTHLRQIRDRLLPRLISGKLETKEESKPTTILPFETVETPPIAAEEQAPHEREKPNPYFKRRVLAAYIIDRLRDEPTFGHVKLMKLMYLCEHLAQVETLSNYHRDAAGPYDNQMIRSIDSQMKKAQWFECIKTDQKYTYKPLANREEYKQWFARYYGAKAGGIEGLLHIFGKEKTQKAEMVATLYEAWQDLKNKQQISVDDAIIHEVLNNWHESKKRIEEDRWRKCLDWMKEKGWVG